MAEIVHVRVSPDEDSIYAGLVGGDWLLYYQQETGEVVRLWQAIVDKKLRTLESSFMSNTWSELLAKYHAHPMNWKVKAHTQMMQRYQWKRELEAAPVEGK